MKFVKKGDGTYYTIIRDMPLIQMDEVRYDVNRFMYFMKILSFQYAYMKEILYDKTNLYTDSMTCTNNSLVWNTADNYKHGSTGDMVPGDIAQLNLVADTRHICPWIEL